MFKSRSVAKWTASAGFALTLGLGVGAGVAQADDWTQWMGNDRLGNWKEDGIVDTLPAELKVKWRKPIGGGYAGPVVSKGKVFVHVASKVPETTTMQFEENVVCLNEETGDTIWERKNVTGYNSQQSNYATGPRAVPTVDGDYVYTLGAAGWFQCLKAETGEVVWSHDFIKEYGTLVPTWGTASSPVIEGNNIIVAVGGKDGLIRGYDKVTGAEAWKSMETTAELSYSPLVVYEIGGARQLIYWDTQFVSSINPKTGAEYWREPYSTRNLMTIATPQLSGDKLLVSSFYSGSALLQLDKEKPAAKMLWQVKGASEMPQGTVGLHSVITTPIIIGDYFYSTCSYGELRGLKLADSERLWVDPTIGRQGRWGSFFWARRPDGKYFINNDAGELIIGEFTPEKFITHSRTKLIEPDTDSGYGPRKTYASIVNWVQPAYANKHVLIKNDHEILRASLAKDDYK